MAERGRHSGLKQFIQTQWIRRFATVSAEALAARWCRELRMGRAAEFADVLLVHPSAHARQDVERETDG